jgi:hypothetical protein
MNWGPYLVNLFDTPGTSTLFGESSRYRRQRDTTIDLT